MKLDFSRIRVPLLITSSFALVANALPVHLNVLTPDNFNETIAKGVWLIEHFSPYCGHCRDFEPIWISLVEETEKSSDPGIHLAQVNCATHGDLCATNKVKGYPQMNVYRNGEFVDTFKGAREFDRLTAYLSKYAEPTSTLELPSITKTSETENSSPTSVIQPLHVQTSRANINPSGSVISLDEQNFNSMLEDGPVFIKFFAPWCGHCKKLAPIWTQLAHHMQHKLNIAEVNCDDHAALCKSQDIQGYPMLYFYNDGVKTEYTGGRKFEQLEVFTEKAFAPPVQELDRQNLDKLVEEKPILYLFLHSNTDTQLTNDFIKASTILLGTPPIYTSTSPELFSRFSIAAPAALVVLKDHITSPAVVRSLESGISPMDIKELLLRHRLPTSVELTQDTFQTVMNAAHRPLVVIAAVTDKTRPAVIHDMMEVGKKWRAQRSIGQRDVVFSWMDAERWASWMKSMYGITAQGEKTAVIVADHGRLVYYDQDQHGKPIKLTTASIFSTIDGITDGKLLAKHSENRLERLARHLNKKMIGIEQFVLNNPIASVLIVVFVLILLFIALKRAIADDVGDTHPGAHRKSSRLD